MLRKMAGSFHLLVVTFQQHDGSLNGIRNREAMVGRITLHQQKFREAG
jgi:hypothetical protein